MSDPLTWTAIQTIRGLLGAITVDNGYYTDLGLGAIVDNRAQIQIPSAPTTVVLAQEITTNENATGRSRRSLTGDMSLSIEYVIPFDSDENPERLAHCGRADIVRALSVPISGQPLGISKITVISSLIESAPQDGADVIVAQVSARADLTESIPLPA